MRYHRFFGVLAPAALALSIPAPASAQSVWNGADTQSAALKWELSYLAMSAVDTVQTIECVGQPGDREE